MGSEVSLGSGQNGTAGHGRLNRRHETGKEPSIMCHQTGDFFLFLFFYWGLERE